MTIEHSQAHAMASAIPTFACTTWEGDHLLLHVGLPFNQPQPPRGTIAWGATKCDRAVRLNGTHQRATVSCIRCYGRST